MITLQPPVALSDIPLDSLTEAERDAWTFPASYHSFHMERLGTDTYLIRDSRTACYHIGTFAEIVEHLGKLECRTLNKVAMEYGKTRTNITILSQDEIDDLLSDL